VKKDKHPEIGNITPAQAEEIEEYLEKRNDKLTGLRL